MKSPKAPKAAPVAAAVAAPPPPPPVAALSTDVSRAAADEKQRNRKNYGWDKTIYRAGGLNSLPTGTSATLGK